MAERDINWDHGYTHHPDIISPPSSRSVPYGRPIAIDRSSLFKPPRLWNSVQDFGNTPKPDIAEIGRDLCRVKKDNMGGYRMNILTEKMAEKLKAVLICKNCEGIMKEACISSSGEQLCSGCEKGDRESKQIPNKAVREMIDSLKCSCPLYLRGCKWLGTLEKCENHLDRCRYVYEACKLGCGELLKREEFGRHEKENCPQRQVKCDYCDDNFKSCKFNEHLDECPKMKVSCDLCGTKIPREEMEQHLKHDCGMVQETCKLGCGMELTRDELRIHEKENCVQRIIQCEHCFIDLIFCDNPKHLGECPEMKVLCDLCGVEKYRKDMTQHLEDDCPVKMLDCPFVKYKCLARMKRKDIDKHLEEKETKHLGLKLTAMEDLIDRQNEIINKQSKEINKQRVKINEQSEIISKQSNESNKQSKQINKQSAEINKLNENNEKHDKEMTTEKSNTSQHNELLYSIANTTKTIWKIEDVINLIKPYHYPKQCVADVAGYSFTLKFDNFRRLSIVFPGTTRKHDRPFITKWHIMLHSCHTINCGIIEVKQKDVTRGCERLITYIPQEDIEKHSELQFLDATKKDLTLEIFITMQ